MFEYIHFQDFAISGNFPILRYFSITPLQISKSSLDSSTAPTLSSSSKLTLLFSGITWRGLSMLFRVIRRPATVSSSCSHKATGGDGEGPGFQHFRLWGDQWPRSMVESTWKGFVMMLRVTRRPLTMSSSISHNEGGTGGFAEGTGFRQKRFDHRESPKAPLPLIRLLHSS